MRTREHFDSELSELQGQLRALGQMAADAVSGALAALAGDDRERCREIVAGDQRIDQAQHQLDAHAIDLIALQQPVARDLRRILAAIAIAAELERIADYAKGIAKYTAGKEGARPLSPPAELRALGEAALDMLNRAIVAADGPDVAAARRLAEDDDTVDELYDQARAAIDARLSADPASAPRTADLIFIAHNLERIADRATNVAERVIYLASGDVVELNP